MICPYALLFYELHANIGHISEHATDAYPLEIAIAKIATASFAQGELTMMAEFELRTPVKIERGTFAGQVGTIAGKLTDRADSLRKAIVRIEAGGVTPEFVVIEISNLRELSQMEMILLGFK